MLQKYTKSEDSKEQLYMDRLSWMLYEYTSSATGAVETLGACSIL